MKFIAQTLVVIFFVLFFAVTLISATIKFELLNYSFWTSSFKTHNVYQKLSEVAKSSIDTQVGRGGGNKSDITVLTDLITPSNTADFVNGNLLNLLNFINGKTTDLKVYIPVKKIPTDILPKNITGLTEEMTLNDLGERFNIVGLDNLPLKDVSKIGVYDYYVLMASTALTGLSLIILILMIGAGKHFIAPGIAFILSGSLTLLVARSGTNFSSYLIQNFSTSTSINKILAVTIVPPVLTDIVQPWTYVGIVLIVVGLLFFLLKKSNKDLKVEPKTKSILLPN